MEGFISQLDVYPRISRKDLNHEWNIEQRLMIYRNIFNMIDTEFNREPAKTQEAQWARFSDNLKHEIEYLEKLLVDSNYGEMVMYSSHLCNLYKMYLQSMTKIYQRPSGEYGKKYNEVKDAIEKLIQLVQNPV